MADDRPLRRKYKLGERDLLDIESPRLPERAPGALIRGAIERSFLKDVFDIDARARARAASSAPPPVTRHRRPFAQPTPVPLPATSVALADLEVRSARMREELRRIAQEMLDDPMTFDAPPLVDLMRFVPYRPLQTGLYTRLLLDDMTAEDEAVLLAATGQGGLTPELRLDVIRQLIRSELAEGEPEYGHPLLESPNRLPIDYGPSAPPPIYSGGDAFGVSIPAPPVGGPTPALTPAAAPSAAGAPLSAINDPRDLPMTTAVPSAGQIGSRLFQSAGITLASLPGGAQVIVDSATTKVVAVWDVAKERYRAASPFFSLDADRASDIADVIGLDEEDRLDLLTKRTSLFTHQRALAFQEEDRATERRKKELEVDILSHNLTSAQAVAQFQIRREEAAAAKAEIDLNIARADELLLPTVRETKELALVTAKLLHEQQTQRYPLELEQLKQAIEANKLQIAEAQRQQAQRQANDELVRRFATHFAPSISPLAGGLELHRQLALSAGSDINDPAAQIAASITEELLGGGGGGGGE